MRAIRTGVAILAAAVAAAGPAAAQQQLGEADQGRVVRVTVGSEIDVRLRQQAGTPYRWQMRRDARVTMTAAPTTTNRAAPGIVGGPQEVRFRIKVLQAGRIPLTFGLRRAGSDASEPPARRVTFTIDATAAAANAPVLSVDDEGLRLVNPQTGSTRPLPFGTARQPMLATLSAQGRVETGTAQECDAGPLAYAEVPGDLTVYFQEGRFVGWALGRRGGGRVTTMAGIAPGSTRAQLGRAYTVRVRESSLGTEFSAGDLYGLLDGTAPTSRITDMWAGTTCATR